MSSSQCNGFYADTHLKVLVFERVEPDLGQSAVNLLILGINGQGYLAFSGM